MAKREWPKEWEIGGQRRNDWEDYSHIWCKCGAAFSWSGFSDELYSFLDLHSPHMKATTNDPPK